MRGAVQVEPGQRLNIKQHKNQVLFSGTKILQHTGDKGARVRTPDGGCLAVVLRTGFETAQGNIARFVHKCFVLRCFVEYVSLLKVSLSGCVAFVDYLSLLESL